MRRWSLVSRRLLVRNVHERGPLYGEFGSAEYPGIGQGPFSRHRRKRVAQETASQKSRIATLEPENLVVGSTEDALESRSLESSFFYEEPVVTSPSEVHPPYLQEQEEDRIALEDRETTSTDVILANHRNDRIINRFILTLCTGYSAFLFWLTIDPFDEGLEPLAMYKYERQVVPYEDESPPEQQRFSRDQFRHPKLVSDT